MKFYPPLKDFKNDFFIKTKTPYFIYKKEVLTKNIELFKKFFQNDIFVYYAVKSNNYQNLIKELVKNNYGFDVASLEELEYILKLGGDVNKVSYSSPTKFESDIEKAVKLGVKMFAFDTESEIKKILKYHPNAELIGRISTPNKDSVVNLSEKFGMTLDYFKYLVKQAAKNNYPIVGFTFHVGSQNTSLSSWSKALKTTSQFIDIAKANKLNIKILNIGGGIPADYGNQKINIDYLIDRIIKLVNSFKNKYQLSKIIVEPGRSISANTMDLVTSILNIKAYKKPPIIETDVSIYMGLIEVLENFEFPITTLNGYLSSDNHTEKRYYIVGGYSCSGNDIINKKVLLPSSLMIYNKLVILNAGAYTSVMENFHMKGYPRIVNK